MKNSLFLIIIVCMLVSCNKKNTEEIQTSDIVQTQEEVAISSIGIILSPLAKKEMEKWPEYQLLASKLEPYNKITKSQALMNAAELALLIKDEFDTISVAKLDRPDMRMRFNVLNNHAYRLQDMETIPAISDDEVKYEVIQLLDAFSSLIDKINVIYKIDEIENQYGTSSIDTVRFFDSSEIKKEPVQKTEFVEKHPNAAVSKKSSRSIDVVKKKEVIERMKKKEVE